MAGPTIHPDMVQGSDEWLAARCGMLTASELSLIITLSTLKPAKNDKASAHLYELLAQRITKYVEPRYVSDDMLRGRDDELEARRLYEQHYASVQEVGFITNDRWGFPMGYSPDGLVGADGLIECKSRRQKFQVDIIISGAVPPEHMIQLQAALLISGRRWIDYISYSGGLPLAVIRTRPDPKIMDAIIDAAVSFEDQIAEKLDAYHSALGGGKWIETERKVWQEMYT